jgi:hypothetical protein
MSSETYKDPGMAEVAHLTNEEIARVIGTDIQGLENLASEIWQNFPEASQGSALQCTRWKYNEWKFRFVDEETGTVYTTTQNTCVRAVAAFIALKMRGHLKGIPIADFKDPCDYDATAADAIAQLACLREVIYG